MPFPASDQPWPVAPAADPTEKEENAAAAEEVDVWWGAYAGRTMLPDFLLSGVLTVGIIGLAWYLGAWRDSSWLRWTTPLLLGIFWLSQIVRWLYRVVTTTYRLTTRRLFYERGFGHPGRPGVWLREVAQVVVERRPFERWMGVGRIRILVRSEVNPPLVLEGVRDPEHIAIEIRKWVKTAQESARP
jgi:hypothetical protein